jgi:hypothetical protein
MEDRLHHGPYLQAAWFSNALATVEAGVNWSLPFSLWSGCRDWWATSETATTGPGKTLRRIAHDAPAPNSPQAQPAAAGGLSSPTVPIVTNKYAAGLAMLCPGGACLKLGPKIPQHQYVL